MLEPESPLLLFLPGYSPLASTANRGQRNTGSATHRPFGTGNVYWVPETLSWSDFASTSTMVQTYSRKFYATRGYWELGVEACGGTVCNQGYSNGYWMEVYQAETCR